MKCVKSSEGKVKRVSDHTAELLMLTGSYFYCPKSEWKALRPTVIKAEEVVVSKETPEERAARIAQKADKRKHSDNKKNKKRMVKNG